MDQKNAVEIKQSIGSQELARKGVSDVATAVTKTSGITKQEGSGNIFVRGLGDRYNSTTMNGLPIPSNDPEKKNLNLEISLRTLLSISQLTRYMVEVYMAILLEETLTLYQRTTKERGFKKLLALK
jgi:hypothetical protein